MKINVFSYNLKLTREFRFKQKLLSKREGYIIECIDDSGRVGFGEIAPLPGFSREDFADIQDEIRLMAQLFIKEPFAALNISTVPSISFGFQNAYSQLNGNAITKEFPIAALIWENDFSYMESVYQSGQKTFKIKVSALNMKDAVDFIQQIKSKYPDVELRIDANQKWSLAEAVFFSSHFSPHDFAYLEEPIRSFEDLRAFSESTLFPVAVDECLYQIPLEKILSLPSLKAVVIKPTLYGGLVECKKLNQELQKKEVDFIISSSFESGLGILALTTLAQNLGVTSALGIDTYRFLKEDILLKPISFSNTSISSQVPEINRDRLCHLFTVP